MLDKGKNGSSAPHRNTGRNTGRITLSESLIVGLLGIQRYRLLSAQQFARIADLNLNYARDQLRVLERKRLLGSIGNVGLGGGAKAPKLYFLNRSGYAALLDATGLDEHAAGPFVRPHTSTQWSPTMAHRLGTIDLLIAAEVAVRDDPRYRIVRTLHEYRRIGSGRRQLPETSDLITAKGTARIVPDAALVLANTERGTSGLYFIECDRGTERITTAEELAYSVIEKFEKYERYLLGGRFAQTYQAHGSFSFATILFATTTPTRIANVRHAARQLRPELHKYFRLSTMAEATADFVGSHWRARDADDDTQHALIRSTST